VEIIEAVDVAVQLQVFEKPGHDPPIRIVADRPRLAFGAGENVGFVIELRSRGEVDVRGRPVKDLMVVL